MLLFFAVSCLQFTWAVVLINRPCPTPIRQTYGIWSNKWQSSPASFIPSLAFVSWRREFPPAGFIVAEWSSVLDAGQKWKITTPESPACNITMTRLQMEWNARRWYRINEDITTTTHVEHNVADLLYIISKVLTFQKSGFFLLVVEKTDAVELKTQLWCMLYEKQPLAALETLKRLCLWFQSLFLSPSNYVSPTHLDLDSACFPS